MRTDRSFSLVAALLLPLAGCNWKSDGLDRLNELYPPPASDAGGPACIMPDDSSAAAVTDTATCTGLTKGRWAVRFVEFGTISPIGSPWNLVLADLFIADLSADGKSLELTFCNQVSGLTNTDGSPLSTGKTNMPQATRDAIGAHKIVFPLPGDGTFSVSDAAWLWGVCLNTTDKGCDDGKHQALADPLNDDVPTDPNDPKVWDEDADGKAGVTVNVQNPDGDRYMARRSIWTLHPGTLSSDGNWVVGPLDFAITEHALGASTQLLTTVAPITPRPECDSVYQLRCVDDTYGCAQLVNDYSALFRDAPKP
jgi:hypothetical protein